MQLFYCPDISSGTPATLDHDESRHAVRVLRMRVGDSIDVTDGRGTLYHCRVVVADEKACVVDCETAVVQNAGAWLHLAVAPTKNPSRMEWLVEKAVEVGVGEITLLQCDHSERSFLKTERLTKIAVSAMKQSLHCLLPVINPVTPMAEWMDRAVGGDEIQKFIAHCDALSQRTPLAAALLPRRDAVVMIGPEGDFSDGEVAAALRQGFSPVSLGPSRLRTETAAIYVACAFNLVNDLQP